MSFSFLLSLKPGISIIETNEKVALQSHNTSLLLEQLSPGLLAAIRMLERDSISEDALSDLVLQTDGIAALPRFYYFLEKFTNLGLICYSVCGDVNLATMIPVMEGRIQLSEVPGHQKCLLSRFAYCHQQDNQMVLESPLAPAIIILHDWRSTAALSLLVTPQTPAELSNQIPGLSPDIARLLLSLFLTVGAVYKVTEDNVLPEAIPPLVQWEFHDLLFHARSRSGRHNNPEGMTHRFLSEIAPIPAVKKQEFTEVIPLYQPDIEKLKAEDYPFTRIVEERTSIRSYGEMPITERELGEFLYRCARVRNIFPKDNMESTSRPYPSGGGCYELELYLAVNACDHIRSGLYHYCPQQHQLGKIVDKNRHVEALLEDARLAASGQQHQPQVLIILAARFPRVTWGYSSIAYATLLKNVGALYQNMYLVATAMNLAPCALGGGNSDLFAAAVGLDYYGESSVGEFMLGSIPE
ncbi:MAG: SagB family peptide dehydrogenase [Oscillatoriaceae cyanobacterium]